MNAGRSAALVRRWVGLYTLGLPPEIKQRRRDEIDDDLWCQARDAAESRRADRSLGGEILARLVFGMPADVTWRVEQRRIGKARSTPERSFTITAPGRGLLAILGGGGWAIGAIPRGLAGREFPTDGPLFWILMLAVVGAIWLLPAATIGLAFLAADRLRRRVLLIAVPGALIGTISALGAYAAIVALPIASAALLYELGRIGAVGPRMARSHVITAALAVVAFGLLLVPGILENPATAVAATSLAIPYGLSWVTIGWDLYRPSIKTSPPASA